jgi:endonuclease III
VLQQQINQIRRFLSNAQTPDSVIAHKYPEAYSLQGVKFIIENDRLVEFLMWQHHTKLLRFVELTSFLDRHCIETAEDLSEQIVEQNFRKALLELHGIGPKTIDYLGCLAGVDTVAVDRHVRVFAQEAGVEINDYNGLRTVFSFAADLLELSRSDFDAWVWNTISTRQLAS